MVRLTAAHVDGKGYYSIYDKVLMAYAGVLMTALGCPAMAEWRLSVHRQENGLFSLRIDLGYTVLEPMLASYLGTPKSADGTHNPYGLHNSVVTYQNLTKAFAYFLYRQTRFTDYLESQLLEKLTRNGLVTLRFDRINLTGTDGRPLLFNDAEWRYAVKKITNGLDGIYDELIKTSPGKALSEASTLAATHLPVQHMMIHLHQERIYGSTDEEVDMLTDAFLEIVKQPGCYERAFGEAIWREGTTTGEVEITTTDSSDGCPSPL